MDALSRSVGVPRKTTQRRSQRARSLEMQSIRDPATTVNKGKQICASPAVVPTSKSQITPPPPLKNMVRTPWYRGVVSSCVCMPGELG